MGVHHDHLLRVDKDGRVAVGEHLRMGLREVHAVRNLLDIEQAASRGGPLRARPGGAQKPGFEHRGSGDDSAEELSEKVAPRRVAVHGESEHITDGDASTKPGLRSCTKIAPMSQWLSPIARAAALWLNAVTMSTLLAQPSPSAGPSVRDAYLSLPGARLFYRDTGGNGVPVVLLHAATGSSQVWEYQIPAFTAAGFRVLAFDRRGWGRTEVEEPGPQLRTAAGDLLALINNLGIERLHLVGTAAGGFVALDFAIAFPDRVRALVVANSIGGVDDPEFVELGRRLRPDPFGSLPPEVRELGPEYRASQPVGTKRWTDLEKISRPLGPPTPAQPLRNRVTLSLLENLQAPTLLLTGGADLYAPPAVLRLFAARIKGAESLIIPQAGHSSYWEQPEVFNRAVLDFLRKH